MCGINGIYAYHYAAKQINRTELATSCDHMAARGPDGSGLWVDEDERLGLAHRRLSIIDLSENGSQPMCTADQRFVVTFNGEIYNYKELRRELEAKGYAFSSLSDTEVLLHLYSDRGPEMVHALRGMFALALWDSVERELFLARDPYGIKPLYYADDGWTFRFSSQVKALLAGGAVSRDPEPAGHVGFYLFGSVPEPFTVYREIRALPAGATLLVNRIGAQDPRRYYSIAQVYCDAETQVAMRGACAEDRIHNASREALLDSVRRHLVADVAVGAFLSSGVDSSSLVGLMRDAGQQDIQTVTLTFEEFRGTAEDEAPLAAAVAQAYGTRHTTRVVTESEFNADLPRIFEAMDQPSIDGVNTWFAAKAAKELGLKVALSGVGGDELFGGYPSFHDVPRCVKLLKIPSEIPLLGKLARILSRPLVDAFGANPKTAGMLELGGTYAGAYLLRRGLFMPWELNMVLEQDVVEQGMRRLAPLQLIGREVEPCPIAPQARVSALESSLYMKNQLLRDTDWASMAHSIEVRVPLVDSTLLSQMASIASSSRTTLSKSLLSEAPSRPLPLMIRSRPKTGFTTPVAIWQQRSIYGAMCKNADLFGSATNPWARKWSRIVKATA